MSDVDAHMTAGDLTHMVAVITGGGRGIGRATAIRLAAAGATVVVVARSHTDLDAVVDEIGKAGGSALAFPADVTDAAEIDGLAGWLSQRFEAVDLLVNCAGAALIAPLEKISESDWDRVIDTNLKGTFLVIRALLGLLRAADGALVVNLASKVGLTGHQQVTAYTAAKAGVIGLSRALAKELRPAGIRVNTLCPGPVDTPMRWKATPDIDPSLLLSAQTVADTVLFLATLRHAAVAGELILEAPDYDPAYVSLQQ
ncbi:MAG TPA: SDR family NAD(P)-dependent oxidoreductase [Candidatus Sulfomarinibacteraceae bacterium]|nr:SDR family NAD(P)-dependent oxidoreductase [Candidatus Sulfomarinibacteraceae bacterium]